MLDRLKRLDDQMLEAQKEHQPGPQCVWAVKEKHRETKHHKTRCVNYFPYVLLLKPSEANPSHAISARYRKPNQECWWVSVNHGFPDVQRKFVGCHPTDREEPAPYRVINMVMPEKTCNLFVRKLEKCNFFQPIDLLGASRAWVVKCCKFMLIKKRKGWVHVSGFSSFGPVTEEIQTVHPKRTQKMRSTCWYCD